MKRIDHIGIAVKNLADAAGIYHRLLGKPSYKTELVAAEQVRTAFFACGESKLELLEDNKENGVISRFIEKRGEGMHHIAFEVDNIAEEIERLQKDGFDFISEEPRRGADNKLICFLHPKKTTGVLIELCQEIR